MLDRLGHSTTVADLDVSGFYHDLRLTSFNDSSLLRCDSAHHMDKEQSGRHESAY